MPIERRGATWIAEISSTAGAVSAAGDAAKDRSARPRAVHGLVRSIPGTEDLLGTVTDPTHPPELFRWSPAGPPKQITHLYDAWLAKRDLVSPEKLSVKNPDGDDVEAWLYPPRSLEKGKKFPLVVYIHGGPQGYDGDYFDLDLENQLFPARGWGVLRVNYRGSTAYGEKFARALWADWHRREYDDLMAALDAAIAGHPWIDAQRLGIGGWSYGGIMTLWTVGHTDRFAVGVPERFSFELYLIANELDKNCPLPQVLQAYQRLKRMGQKTELVIYPGEAHTLSSPAHLVDRLERLVAWFSRHLNR